jgi:MFS family permease
MTKHAASGGNANTFSKRLLWILVGVTFVLLVLHLTLQYLNLVVFSEKHGLVFELSNRFDFDDESSIPTWVSQAVFLGVGASAFFAAYMSDNGSRRNLWRVIGAGAVLVSIDEILALHETFLQSMHTLYFGDSAPQAFANAWWFLLPFVLIIAVWIIVWMVRVLPVRTVWLFAFGAFVYLVGAAGFDIVTNSIAKDSYASQGILVAAEQTLEMIGGFLFFYAVADYIESHYKPQLKRAMQQLKS